MQSFNGKLRAEGLIPEIFTSLTEGGILVERWRWEDKQVPPHSAIVPQHIPGSISRSGFIGASSTAGGRGGRPLPPAGCHDSIQLQRDG